MPVEANQSRLILLSKEDTSRPPLGRIRPIAMYSPVRKVGEGVIDRLDRDVIWRTIKSTQYGAR